MPVPSRRIVEILDQLGIREDEILVTIGRLQLKRTIITRKPRNCFLKPWRCWAGCRTFAW